MIKKDIHSVLGLLLVAKIKSCETAYGLNRILSSQFNIIELVDFIENLMASGFVTSVNINGMKYFKVSEKGYEYLSQKNLDYIKLSLLEENSSKKDFIEALFN